MKKKIVELKNLYTTEVVYTENYNNVRDVGGMQFIEVFKSENPQRKYLVNKEAFKPVTK